VATEVVPEDQVTADIISHDEPSEYVPVAVNCLVSPLGMDGLAGVTAIVCSVAAFTVSVVLSEMLPDVAVMTDEPTLMLLIRPLAETVATDVVPEDQVTEVVMLSDVPSEYAPVAVN
jgi:hypothetical protein